MRNVRGYIKLRKGLKDHIQDGRMTGLELSIYVALHLFADHKTGVVYKISAPFLAQYLGFPIPRCKKCLWTLEKKGYIKRFNHRGRRNFYETLIDKFRTSTGYEIDAAKSLSLKEIAVREITPQDDTGNLSDDSKKLSRNLKRLNIYNIRSKKEKIYTDPPRPKSKTPTLKQVEEYITEKKLNVDGKKFHKYYTDRGWIKANGRPVLNWKNTLWTWHDNNERNSDAYGEKTKRSGDGKQTATVEPDLPFGATGDEVSEEIGS